MLFLYILVEHVTQIFLFKWVVLGQNNLQTRCGTDSLEQTDVQKSGYVRPHTPPFMKKWRVILRLLK